MKYFLHTQIGIENIAEIELFDKFKGEFSLDQTGFIPHKNGFVLLDWRGRSKELEAFPHDKLGTIEDAFFVIAYIKNINEDFSLKAIYQSIDREEVKRQIDYFFDKINPFDYSPKFRFITRKKAANDFRRVDLEDMVKDFFKKNIRRVKVTEEEGEKEIWTTLIKNRLIIGIRLTTKEKRQGSYKEASVTGSLRPTVAFAMNYIAELKSSETIWDPFCGAGTIGCEISENFKFKRMILSDISNEAIEATKINLNNLDSYKKNKGKISIRHENFFISKSYSDVIISNLPFGNQYAIEEDFIQKFFDKINSIPQIKRVVLLYPDLIEANGWQLTRKFEIQVLGYPAFIQVHKKIA